jgi:hypothetical protein
MYRGHVRDTEQLLLLYTHSTVKIKVKRQNIFVNELGLCFIIILIMCVCVIFVAIHTCTMWQNILDRLHVYSGDIAAASAAGA